MAGGVVIATVIGISGQHADRSTPVDLLSAPSPTGTDAFTIGPYTFDPFTIPDCPTCATTVTSPYTAIIDLEPKVEGWSTVSPLATVPPLLEIGGGEDDGISLSPQFLAVYNSGGTLIGFIDVSDSVSNLLGNYGLEMTAIGSWAGCSAYDFLHICTGHYVIPPTGSVYDIMGADLGFIPYFTDLRNVYAATPGSPVSEFVHDYLVTSTGPQNVANPVVLPHHFGTLDLQGLLNIDATKTMAPGDAFTGLHTAADSSISSDAFTMDGYTFNPVIDDIISHPTGYNTMDWLGGAPPLFELSGLNVTALGTISIPLLSQDFDIYSGTTKVGSIGTDEEVQNLLGMTSTQFTVTSSSGHAPADGTVYDVFNVSKLGLGDDEFVYIATPSGATETLVTNSGETAMPVPFNAAIPLTMGPPLAALSTDQPYDNNSAIGPLAFTIDDYTFNPENDLGQVISSYPTLPTTYDAPGLVPLDLRFAGGSALGISLASELFYVYHGSGPSATKVGSIDTAVSVTNFLDMINTEFTSDGCYGICSGAVPAKGTVFDVLQLAPLIVNTYSATPSGTVTDTLMTPLGPMFYVSFLIPEINAAAPLDPGDAIPYHFDVPF